MITNQTPTPDDREALAQIREWCVEVGTNDPVFIDHVIDILNEYQAGHR